MVKHSTGKVRGLRYWSAEPTPKKKTGDQCWACYAPIERAVALHTVRTTKRLAIAVAVEQYAGGNEEITWPVMKRWGWKAVPVSVRVRRLTK